MYYDGNQAYVQLNYSFVFPFLVMIARGGNWSKANEHSMNNLTYHMEYKILTSLWSVLQSCLSLQGLNFFITHAYPQTCLRFSGQ